MEREGYDLARPDGTLREFDTLVFWSLKRFSREGIRKTVAHLQQLEALGVRIRSYSEPYLSTENESVSHVLLGMPSYFAEYEAQKISRRIIAGLERARVEGKQLGGPSTFGEHRGALEEMLDSGVAKAEMARRTRLAYNTVKGHLRRIKTERVEGAASSA